jgi:branched-chain amino acid transport system ATP-binding protein
MSSADVSGNSSGTPALELEQLSVTYGGIRAVKGISLRVEPGQIVALIGANGAGKTSTLKGIVGLLSSVRGRVRVFGQDVLGVPTHRIVAQGVTLVPEGRAIFQGMSVRENLELGSILKRDARGIAARMERVLALFPRLGERMTQASGTLSGGEQQMLAIGRALMSEPRLLLLDEPSLGLAPKLVRQIFDGIIEIAKSGLTILLVEQNTRLALETAHQAYVLVTGEIALSGSSASLREDPRVRAAYLGEDMHV